MKRYLKLIISLTTLTIILSINLSAQIQGIGRTLDKTNCVPGSIGGTIDISPTGAASASIPIQVSPGSHGV